MQREINEYYEDDTVFEDDLIKFKDIIKTIDIARYANSQRAYCEIVEEIYVEIFNKGVGNEQEDK